MKIKLKNNSELKILKRNEKLIPECCYLLNSESVARNLYFEKRSDVIRAHRFFIKHLCPIMDIVDYLFTPNGWLLLVVIKSQEEILANIDRKLYDSKTMRSAIRHKKVSVIISQCIRYAISGIAGKTNERKNRKGTLVSRNFRRFIFNNIESAKKIIAKMRKQQIQLCWQGNCYKPSMKLIHEATEVLVNGDVFLCTKKYERSMFEGGQVDYCIKIINKKIDVLRKIINNTIEFHSPYSHIPLIPI